MEGLTQSHIMFKQNMLFKQKLLSCEPIYLSRLSWTSGTDVQSFGHLFLIATLESATAKRLPITSGAHCLHKKLWLPILPIGFPGTCFLTFLKMSFAVWLVSDFVSTPIALKPQLGVQPLPLLATYVRLMMMSRMKNMFSFPALNGFLSAGSVRSYFHRPDQKELLAMTSRLSSQTTWLKAKSYFLIKSNQDRMCLLFYTTNSTFSLVTLLFYFAHLPHTLWHTFGI